MQPGGRRVLDVGCGTGRLSHALAERGARVWGVDPSEEMLARARAAPLRSGGFKRAHAERLPFKEAWFHAAVLRQVVHVVDRPLAFSELARVLVPGGTVVVATFHPDHFQSVWVTRVFPRVAELDRARFPRPELLAADLRSAGFGQPRLRRLVQYGRIRREEALERLRGRFISTLHLLDEVEYAEGLARAERELPDEVESRLDWVIVAADRVGAGA